MNQDLQDFEDYRGRLWIKLYGHLRGILLIPAFRRCVDAPAKSFEMKEPSNNNLSTQTGGIIDNPENPVNPDSKPGVADKFILKPVGEKTRGIASLQR